jgi:hypothetical protein
LQRYKEAGTGTESRATLDAELADCVIAADFVGLLCGVNICEAVEKKFNASPSNTGSRRDCNSEDGTKEEDHQWAK